MPIYEYVCSECNLPFELLRPLAEASSLAPCPNCQTDGLRVPSPFARFKVATIKEKWDEEAAEKQWKAERKRQSDPLLDPDNWLEHVKKQKLAAKEHKREIERYFGKESDAPLKYAASVENLKRIQREDPWA